MTIIIPMAGLSSRFTRAGFTLPKYMLYIDNKSLFYHAVNSFSKYFKSCKFVFIVRDVFDTPRFVKEECNILGIENYNVVRTEPTRGQAETVLKGIAGANISNDESILIFNIDTIRPGFTFPSNLTNCDGYLECFIGNGSNWSYAKTIDGTPDSLVIETAEKHEISNYCSTGIYYFRQCLDFVESYNFMSNSHELIKELYVAPLYNIMIKQKKSIRINVIDRDEVIFCGIPEEYTEYLKKSLSLTS